MWYTGNHGDTQIRDGFRMDAITFIKKDLTFPPMPSDGEDGRCDVGKCCLNRPGIDDFLRELKENTYGRGDFVTVAETPGVPNEDLERYIGRDGHFSMIFDFSYTDIGINPGDLWLHQRDWTISTPRDSSRDALMPDTARLRRWNP